MPKFSANVSMLFKEVEFLHRFERAARYGFKAVEFLFPYEWDKDELQDLLDKNGLEVVLHNLPAGHWVEGERGLACLPERVNEFQESVGVAIEYARALKCPRLNCLAGIPPVTQSTEQCRETLTKNVRYAAEASEKAGIALLVEALNSHDVPGYCLNSSQQMLDLIKAVDHPNLSMQYDIYHMQIMEGNLTRTMSENVDRIGHMQLADVPGRHEPGTGEINFENLFQAIDNMGYKGWIGCEYNPTGATEDSLGWVKQYL